MKTVYILGAGFSKGADAPMQYELVKEIFEIQKKTPSEFHDRKFDQFRDFIQDTMCLQLNDLESIALEDLFTPIDRCILDNIAYRNVSITKLKEIREIIYYLIGKTIEIKLRGKSASFINKFATHLVQSASQRMNHNFSQVDPVAVISTNWDILLDQAIKREIEKNHSSKAVVDYCCYISSYNPNDETIKPGLQKLGEGGFNVKLLKLHGSLNWLHCPRCMRIYVSFEQKIAAEMIDTKKCHHCEKNFTHDHAHYLTSNLIMPTFLKDLSNPQYKIIWQNAGIELSEADKIVFIGYSLPLADFEMRQLLSRMVRTNAEIKVVDKGSDNNPSTESMKLRYRSFFGNRSIQFHLEGAESYINQINPQL
jgi:NAD-dependent SIR2 family protein deacetylase